MEGTKDSQGDSNIHVHVLRLRIEWGYNYWILSYENYHQSKIIPCLLQLNIKFEWHTS